MCTAVAYKTKGFYFGRTLDSECIYPSEITITPRRFPLDFRLVEKSDQHLAFFGMAYVKDDFPLYFDGMNEKGLAVAGLNFVGNAVYHKAESGKENIASFEFIPYILSRCASVKEAKNLLENINISDVAFDKTLPPSSLHWLIGDKDESVVVESLSEGVKVYENPLGVLTNNPPFDAQLLNFRKYAELTSTYKEKRDDNTLYSSFTRGEGAFGLPGDYTSQSRFVRAAFLKENSPSQIDEKDSVNQFFHIMNGVSLPKGACKTETGADDFTRYVCCMSAEELSYCCKVYEGQSVFKVSVKKENLDTDALERYPLENENKIVSVN